MDRMDYKVYTWRRRNASTISRDECIELPWESSGLRFGRKGFTRMVRLRAAEGNKSEAARSLKFS